MVDVDDRYALFNGMSTRGVGYERYSVSDFNQKLANHGFELFDGKFLV